MSVWIRVCVCVCSMTCMWITEYNLRYWSTYSNMLMTESIVARHCGHQSSRSMFISDSWHRIAEVIDAHSHIQGSEDLNSGPQAWTANMLPTESSPQTSFYVVSQNIFKRGIYTLAVHFSSTWERASPLQHTHHRRDKDKPCYLIKTVIQGCWVTEPKW